MRSGLFAALICLLAGSLSAQAGRPAVADTMIYFEFQVEKPAAIRGDPRMPRYPMLLQCAGIEGAGEVMVVVDREGYPEPDTYRLVRTTNAVLEPEMRAAIFGTRFVPGEVKGRPVRQLVHQRYEFTLPSQGSAAWEAIQANCWETMRRMRDSTDRLFGSDAPS